MNIIIWGGSTRLTGEDIEVQNELQKLIKNGITVKACSDKLKLTTKLKDLGITVKYMSKLTGLIKGKERLITI